MLFNDSLLLIIFILFAGFVGSLIFPSDRLDVIRPFVLLASMLSLFVGVASCFTFSALDDFQFLFRFDIMPQYNLSLTLGIDGITMVFLLLTLLIFPLCFLSCWEIKKQTKQFFSFLIAMELLLVLTFTTLDLFYFYVFFESLLIPMFIMIGLWGSRDRKIKAAYYFFLYTLAGSLIMLLGLFYLYFTVGSTNYFMLFFSHLEKDQQSLLWLAFLAAFGVKMPMFPVHIWLPEAHVEAPTEGSMLLASLLLKLGGYGFLRFSLGMVPYGAVHHETLVFLFGILGVLYGSLITIRQIDLKRIIAYSSVAHMNLVLLAIFCNVQQGLDGAVYLMIGHGIVSTGLFFCVGVLYARYHSRFVRYYGGMVVVMPLFVGAFFVLTLANMSFPGTCNFIGELLILTGLAARRSISLLLGGSVGVILAAVYAIWIYNRISFGTLKTRHIEGYSDVNFREFTILVTLVYFVLLFGVVGSIILNMVSFSTLELLIFIKLQSFF